MLDHSKHASLQTGHGGSSASQHTRDAGFTRRFVYALRARVSKAWANATRAKKTEPRGGPIPRIRSALPLRSLISRRTPRLINASCYPPPRARLARYACVEYRRGEPRLGAGETKLDALLHKSATVRLAAISHLGKAAAPCRNSSGLLATGTTYAACCVLCQPERGVTLVR